MYFRESENVAIEMTLNQGRLVQILVVRELFFSAIVDFEGFFEGAKTFLTPKLT